MDISSEFKLFLFSSFSDIEEFVENSSIKIDIMMFCVDGPDNCDFDSAKEFHRSFPDTKMVVMSKTTVNIERLFELRLSYFLLYPLSEERFIQCLKILRNEILNSRIKYLIVNNKSGIYRIRTSSIYYLESDRRKVNVYYENTVISYYSKLDDLEKDLDPSFLRCHKSYLVNMDKIKEFYIDEVHMNNEVLIPISQKKYSKAKMEYLGYISKL